MENKVVQHQDDRLLDARKDALANAELTSIRPHGKLWGMDVFSWYKPNIHVLTNTIHAFPFPVIWVGNSEDIKVALNEDSTLKSNINAAFAHDNTRFLMEFEKFSDIENIAGADSVEEALHYIQSIRKKSSIVLFTASDNEWKDKKECFENFLNEHKQ